MAHDEAPYVGPRSFKIEDESKFFGRESETNRLFLLIKADQVVLLYSQSGAGKTSLLNAGVLPLLKDDNDDFGVARVGGELPKDVQPERVQNIFVFNALLSLQGESKRFTNESLYQMSFQDFLRAQPNPNKREGFHPLRVIIFDQFEELFTSFPDRWPDQETFFANVCAALAADPLLHVVFAMREEHIAALDPFAAMLPQKLQRRFRLERLGKKAALDAIVKPLEKLKTGRSFKQGAAEQLVDNLLQVPLRSFDGTVVDKSGEYVEPVHLQIVCKSLWDSVQQNKDTEIDVKEVEKWDVDKALIDYYEDCLRRVAGVGVHEGKLRHWFETDLITTSGTRGIVSKEESGLTERAFKMLEDLLLIRPVMRAGATWYELTHDRFIGPIRKSNQQWREQHGGAILRSLETKAGDWDFNKRPSAELLSAEELQKVELWLKTYNVEELGGQSDVLRAYIRESKSHLAREREKELRLGATKARRRFLWMTLVAIAAVVLAAYTIYTLIKARRAIARETQSVQITKGNQAKTYAGEKGKEYDALRLGIEAVKPLGFAGEPPYEAREGLLAALTKSGNKVWLRECTGAVDRLDFSPDGKLVLSVSNDKFHVWNAATGKHLYNFPESGSGTVRWRQLEFSPDSKLLYAISEPVQNEATGSKVSQEPTEPQPWDNSRKKIVLILDAATGQIVQHLQAALKDVGGLRFSRDGSRILAETLDSKVIIVDTETGKVRSPFPLDKQRHWSQLDLSQNRLVAINEKGEAELWDTDSGQNLSTLSVGVAKGDEEDTIRSSSDGKYGMLLRVVHGSGLVFSLIWEDNTGQKLARTPFKDEVGEVEHVTFTPDSKGIIIFGEKQVIIRQLASDEKISRQRPAGDIVHFDEANVLLAGAADGKSFVSVWNALSGETAKLLETSEYTIKDAMAPLSLGGDTTLKPVRLVTTSTDNITLIVNLYEPLDFEQLSTDELRRLACDKLRYQEEYRQVEVICNQ